MKRIPLLVVATLAASTLSYARILTVSNQPFTPAPGQYANTNDALNVANPGDTIYVHGSNFSYGSVNIGLPVVVIGAGFNPNKQFPYTTQFGRITVSAWGIQLIGLTVASVEGNAGDIVIRRCRFREEAGYYGASTSFFSSNWRIEGCIFESMNSWVAIDMGGSGPHIIQHNVFALRGTAIRGVRGFPGSPSYVLNNVFLGDPSGASVTFTACNTLVIRNNIFYGFIPYYDYDVPPATIIERNITANAPDNNFYPIGNYPDNIIGIDPEFSSLTAWFPFLFTNDLTLGPLSLGNNYGTDLTDVGVFGGFGNIFTMTGSPSIAEITTFNITSPTTIAPGGSLTISVTSTRIK